MAPRASTQTADIQIHGVDVVAIIDGARRGSISWPLAPDNGQRRPSRPTACHTADVGYVLGTDSDELTLTADGVIYNPFGVSHAVDTSSPLFPHSSQVCFAVCGAPVLIWKEQSFDPACPPEGAHEACAELARQDSAAAESERPQDNSGPENASGTERTARVRTIAREAPKS